MVKMFVLLVTLLVTGSLGEEGPVIETKNGLVRGVNRISYNGNTFSSFEGIPYAKPPVRELRFKEPQPMTTWTGTWLANTTHTCIQHNSLADAFEGQEDCLYLNIYVPRRQPNGKENLNVIAYIHPGGFMIGAGHWEGPNYLMDRDLVLVNFNYRLGPFGFLSTQDDAVVGNLGLRDQTMALKWIQTNIVKFGGNPNSVTLTGISAGGASTQYHYLSPLSQGLFHRGFSQSGTVLVPWALQKAPVEKAKKLAVIVGCYDEISANMIKCLQERSAQEIVKAVPYFYEDKSPFSPFGPSVEPNSKNAFLPNHPYYLIRKGIVNDVPWITSITTDEGIIPAIEHVNELEYVDKNWGKVAPNLLDFNFTASPSQKEILPAKIKEHYFLNRTISKETIKNLVRLLTDRLFAIDAEKASRQQAKAAKSSVYFLVVGFRGQHSLQSLFPIEPIDGVAHADDAFLYSKFYAPNEKLNEPTEKMKDLYLNMLVEYAHTGIPKFGNVNWKPVSNAKKLSHLFIRNPDDIYMKEVNELGATEFWRWASLKENENIVQFIK